MSKTRVERIANIDDVIAQLKNRQKQLQQQQNAQERKARTNRLCRRGGLWESLLPDTITLTDEQFKVFLEKTMLTGYAEKVLNGLKEQNADRPVEPKPYDVKTITANPTEMEQTANATKKDRNEKYAKQAE